jgi:hypothetical protein
MIHPFMKISQFSGENNFLGVLWLPEYEYETILPLILTLDRGWTTPLEECCSVSSENNFSWIFRIPEHKHLELVYLLHHPLSQGMINLSLENYYHSADNLFV